MRLSVDVGGTFTDLVVDDGAGLLKVYKSPTTSPDPIEGVLDVVALAAAGEGRTTQALLAATDMFIHSTTRAINAVVTGKTARTAFLTTRGHPDILLVREGGRTRRLQLHRIPYPAPYVPRSLTFEVRGADRRRRTHRPAARRGLGARYRRPAEGGGRRGGRRLPAVVDRQSGPRAARSPRSWPSGCRTCRSRCRTSSTRRCASTAAPRRAASTPR